MNINHNHNHTEPSPIIPSLLLMSCEQPGGEGDRIGFLSGCEKRISAFVFRGFLLCRSIWSVLFEAFYGGLYPGKDKNGYTNKLKPRQISADMP